MSYRPKFYRAARGGKFGYLLVSLLALLLTAPLVTEGMLWTTALSVFAAVLLVAALYAVKPGRFSLNLGVTFAIIDFGIGRIASVEGYRWLLCLQAVLWMVTLGYVTIIILKHVLASQPVTLETLQAAFCVFLLLGLVWTYFYIIVELVNPGSFESAESVPISWSSEGSSRNGFIRFLIMSYATISARDYEGLGPSRDFASICNCLESIMAQVYLAVIVARLVGLQVSDAERSKEPDTS